MNGLRNILVLLMSSWLVLSCTAKHDPRKRFSTQNQTGGYSLMRLGGRRFVADTLEQIFGPSATEIVRELVLEQVAAFSGEPCDPYAEGCGNHSLSQLPMVPSATAPRMALIMRACQRILRQDESVQKAIENALQQSVLDIPQIDDASIVAVLELFYPGREVPNFLLEELGEFVLESKELGYSDLDTWRYFLDLVCESPFWEIP